MKKVLISLIILISVFPFTGCIKQNNNEAKDVLAFAEKYHTVDGNLIDYVGTEEFNKWIETRNANFTILDFIEYFKIPKDIFTELARPNLTKEQQKALCTSQKKDYSLSELQDILGYSLAEIDALYSGDQEQINRAFCGDFAFVNDADGKIYSIEWLATHTPQEYINANLSISQIETLIQKVYDEEPRSLGYLAKQTEENLKSPLLITEN